MRTCTIHQSSRYTVTSYGNGWAYLVQRHSDRHDLWLQDDDAHTFRHELDSNGRYVTPYDNAISEYDGVFQPSRGQE